jgi:hypothetical protein
MEMVSPGRNSWLISSADTLDSKWVVVLSQQMLIINLLWNEKPVRSLVRIKLLLPRKTEPTLIGAAKLQNLADTV